MDGGSICIKMETFIRVSGSMDKNQALDSTFRELRNNSLESGAMITSFMVSIKI
jgi:hypothetical protein